MAVINKKATILEFLEKYNLADAALDDYDDNTINDIYEIINCDTIPEKLITSERTAIQGYIGCKYKFVSKDRELLLFY